MELLDGIIQQQNPQLTRSEKVTPPMQTNVTSEQIRGLAEQANRLAKQGNHASSRSVWEQLLAISPENALGLNYLGQEALARGEFAIARDLLQRAISSEQSFALAHANLARARAATSATVRARWMHSTTR